MLFFLPGTFLHELAHYAAALLLGKARGFSVIPRIEDDRVVFGSVRSNTKIALLSSFIAAAPLLWWAVAFGMLVRYTSSPGLHLAQLTQRASFSSRHILFAAVAIQLLWAGTLSKADVKNVFRGLLSPSGLVFLSILSVLLAGYLHFRQGLSF